MRKRLCLIAAVAALLQCGRPEVPATPGLSTEDQVRAEVMVRLARLARDRSSLGQQARSLCVAQSLKWVGEAGVRTTDPSPALIEVLQRQDPRFVAGSSCALDSYQQVVGPQGRGWMLWAESIQLRGRRAAVAQASYYEEPLSGATYTCKLRRSGGAWAIASCDVTAVS